MATGEEHILVQQRRLLPDGQLQNIRTTTTTLNYVDRWTTGEVNVRVQPNKSLPAVRTLPRGYEVRVIEQVVSPQMLVLMGLNYAIDANYRWHLIVEGEYAGKFIAGNFLTASVPSAPPTTPPPTTPGKITPPMPLNGLKGLTLQTVGGNTYLRGGQYMGVNLREAIYWGHPNIAPYMSQSDWGKYFGFLTTNDIKWVRVYVLNLNAGIDDTIARMRAMLNVAEAHGIRVCACFCDSIGDEIDSGAKHRFTLKSHEDFHTGPLLHLNRFFYLRNIGLGEMLTLVKRVVAEFRNHKGLGMWEVMNESAVHPQPATQADADAVERTIYSISEAIWTLDKSTPISAGFIATNQFCPQGVDLRTYSRAFWNKMKYLHVYAGHVYQDLKNPGGVGASESYCMIDMEEAQRSGRATGIGELGANSNRDQWLRGLMDRMTVQGDASFLWQWALELAPYDKGIGDNLYGWGTRHHSDFDALRIAFVDAGRKLRAR